MNAFEYSLIVYIATKIVIISFDFVSVLPFFVSKKINLLGHFQQLQPVNILIFHDIKEKENTN